MKKIRLPFVAYFLSFFILVWVTVETLQVMHIVPDYIHYTYRNKILSGDSKHVPFSEMADKKIKVIIDSYVWKNKEMQLRAYSFLKKLPSPYFLDDFSSRVNKAMKNKSRMHLDEILFYRLMKESFVATTTSSFENLLKESVKQFKEETSQNHNLYKPGVANQNSAFLPAKGVEKMTFIKEHFSWESTEALELACHLLNRFSIQFLSKDGLIKRLENKLAETKRATIDEKLLCQVMKEFFSASTETIFTYLLNTHVQKFSNEQKL